MPNAMRYGPDDLTPIELHDGVWVKRDDFCEIAGVRGGKVRTCWALAQGARGLVTAGSRHSPQAEIVAHIANHLHVPCRIHMPQGERTPQMVSARSVGAEIVQHKAGYNSVIVARAREDAFIRQWIEIPFGMECTEAGVQTAKQTVNLPLEAKRLVVPVGSGMSLVGILWGLLSNHRSLPVTGIVVGADPTKRFNRYGPKSWRDLATLVSSGMPYEKPSPVAALDGLELDPIYEAKCLPWLREGDVFWIVGRRGVHAEH